LGFDYYI
jgi:hypothetical protein